MKSVLAALAVTSAILAAPAPAHALQDGKELLQDCTRGNPFSNGYCEGFIVGVLATHLSPWVVNLQQGKTYFCIPPKVTFRELAAVVEKYLADNPSRHRYRADTNVWTAVTEAFPCSNEKNAAQ